MIMSSETSLNAADASTGEKQNAALGSSQLLGHCTKSTELLSLSSDIQSLACCFFFLMKTNCTISHNLYHGVSWTNPKITAVHRMPPWQKAGSACLGALSGAERRSRACSPWAASRSIPHSRQSKAGCSARPCLFKSILCQVPAVLLQKSDFGRGGRKCLMETGSPSDSCAEECGAGGTGQRSLCF